MDQKVRGNKLTENVALAVYIKSSQLAQ